MNTKLLTKIHGLLLSVTGIISIIFGAVCGEAHMPGGVQATEYTYGGDAYTGIQNAAAQTANNVRHLSYDIDALKDVVTEGFRFVLIITGLVLIITGVFKILKALAQKDTPEIAVSAYSNTQDYARPLSENLSQTVPVYNETAAAGTGVERETE